MPKFTTNLAAALAAGDDVNEYFRRSLETAINQLLESERTVFLDYEKWDPVGYNSGNSRNGYYSRTLKSEYGELRLRIPRDRLGEFQQHSLPAHKQSSASLEATIIQLYQKGITTHEIADLVERMYGQHYSAATVSNLAKLIDKDVQAFHQLQVKDKYVAVYCDATYLYVRRDTVDKEALHVLIGIDAQGYKEVLDYALYPAESCHNCKEMLLDLKTRGLEQVLVFISAGLVGLPDAVTDVFPHALHQTCWTHLQRHVLRHVRAKDKAEITQAAKRIYEAESAPEAQARLEGFWKAWQTRYPRVTALFEGKMNLFSFYHFPASIRRSLYTNNLAESLNKRLKRITKVKEQFPNEDALQQTVCTSFLEYNAKAEGRKHRGFTGVTYELDMLFQ